MKIKNILLTLLAGSVGFTLTSCGSGAESPTSKQNYGEVVSISKQQLNTIPTPNPFGVPLPYYEFISLGFITGIAGSYIDPINLTTNITDQNGNATSTNYNYDFTENFDTDTTPAIAESVSAYAVEYKTPGQNSETDPAQIVRTASGLVITPNMKSGNEIKGVVVYFHPTTIGKNQVPSCLGSPAAGFPDVSANIPAYCNITALDNTGAGSFAALAFLYAANGYVVVAPDYLGQGSDAYNVHPYVAYPTVNVQSALNMLPATRQILASDYGIAKNQVLPLFVTGYSEGGGYALKASQMIQSDSQFINEYGLNLMMTSPQEGAYSLKDQMNFAFAEKYDGLFNCPSGTVCGESNLAVESQYLLKTNSWNAGSAYYAAQATPYLVSYVLTAVNYYSFNNLTSAYDFTMNNKFWSQISIGGKIANLYQLFSAQLGYIFSGGNEIAAIVTNTIGINGYDPLVKPSLKLYNDGNPTKTLTLATATPNGVPYGNNNTGANFMNPGIQTNPDFIRIVNDGTTYNWQTHSPINFIYMRNDSAVTPLNSKQAISCMKYGRNFTGDNVLSQPSASNCTAPASGSYLIGETVIPNYQVTNNLQQMIPGNPSVTSQFFVNPGLASNPAGYFYVSALNQESSQSAGTPFDHGDMFVLGNIIALCNFENMIESNKISSYCPDRYNPS